MIFYKSSLYFNSEINELLYLKKELSMLNFKLILVQ